MAFAGDVLPDVAELVAVPLDLWRRWCFLTGVAELEAVEVEAGLVFSVLGAGLAVSAVAAGLAEIGVTFMGAALAVEVVAVVGLP